MHRSVNYFTGERVAGTNYLAQLYYGHAGADAPSLVPVLDGLTAPVWKPSPSPCSTGPSMERYEDEPRLHCMPGQFLAFIHQYSILNGCAPAEAGMQRFFCITPPTVRQMVLPLEQCGFIRRVPRAARSITLIVPPESLPALRRAQDGTASVT